MNNDSVLKTEVKKILGGRCASPACRWLNEDGTFGCTDLRGLEFDHISGGGSSARREGKDSVRSLCLEVKRKNKQGEIDFRIQLLCGTCHEIKKKEEQQSKGARSHKQPARVRRSLQKPGEEPRRVKRSYHGQTAV